MGSNYYIAGVSTDLRETGSIEEVRRYSIATCQVCCYSDYSWDFLAPDELDGDARAKLSAALDVDASAPGPALNRTIRDFERFELASRCFAARGLDTSSLAELALLSYYVAQDLGRRDLEPKLRLQAADLFARALEEEDLPGPLRLRYAYLAGELNRRSGRRDQAKELLEQAVRAAEGEADQDDPEGSAWDIARLARRMHAAVIYHDAPANELLELTREDDLDVAGEARRMLASQRDPESVATARTAWEEAGAQARTEMLRELVIDPSQDHADLFSQALASAAPEDIRLAARGLGELGQAEHAEPLMAALERGILSTEAALVEALRRLEAEGTHTRVAETLAAWEERDRDVGDDAWYFSSDTTPLRHLLYTSGTDAGRELLLRDMRELKENDLWDKVPSGGPVSAALSSEDPQVGEALRELLSSPNPASRRWSAYCLAERGEGAAEIAALVDDAEQVVRLQAASSLATLGDASHEDVVLRELRALADPDLPFALHFLVPFRSGRVKAFLLEQLDRGTTTASEILPLLGRQEPDESLGEVLSMALLETNDDTRAGAVTGLAYQGGTQAATRLRLLYDQEDSEEVQRRIIHGLGHLAAQGVHRDETVAFLRDRLGKANPRLRLSIAMTLLRLDDPTGIDLVRERAALFEESLDRYDLVAPALKALAQYEARSA
jgi:hypothetical protein